MLFAERIKELYVSSKAIYGSPKIHADLIAEGVLCSENRLARLMKKANIKSKITRKFVITTNSKNTMQPAPNLIKRQFKVHRPDKAWVSDTTSIGTREGWLYLTIIMDLYSR